MKAIICGAGPFTRDLVYRLGERWSIVVVDTDTTRLTDLAAGTDVVVRTIEGDASSPVILEEAGLDEADFLLALTDSDKVNLAACRFASENRVPHVLALVHDADLEPKFTDLGARVVMPQAMIGRTLYHYLQDPRIAVFSIAHGRGEVVEVDISKNNWVVGLSVASFENPDWRVSALFREGELLYPEISTSIQAGDRLVLMGKRDFFRGVCSLLECTHLPFPLAFGRGILLVLGASDEDEAEDALAETMYLAPNTRVGHVTVLHGEERADVDEVLRQWTGRVEIRTCTAGKKQLEDIRRVCGEESIGLVVLRPFEKSFFKSLARPEYIALAHNLPSPMLLSRNTHPYERILVPFNGTPMAVTALQTALDLAEQLGTQVDAVFVEEPEFLHSGEEEEPRDMFEQVRELTHIHKTSVGELLLTGNPVREITALAADYNLMILGSTSKDKELLSPHVGELLAEKSPCSVLVLTS